METCDVLIVGGGPAGSSCAWQLRRAGVDVIVLDKSPFPRPKVCAGWITPHVIDELELSVEDYQSQCVMQPITCFITGLIGGSEVETQYDGIVSYGIRRSEFDDYLLRRTNARLRLGETFRSLRADADGWVVNEAYRARILIGAGGHFCPVARMIHQPHEFKGSMARGDQQHEQPRQSNQPTVVAQEVEFAMTESQQQQCSVLPERPELFFCPDFRGYGWVFRKDNYLNIGLGREGETNLSAHVESFVTSLKERGKIPTELPDRFHGHAYHLRTILPPPPIQPRLLLIGDAAGLADLKSGEGIRPAIESGLLAASTILELSHDRTDELAKKYATKLRQRFGNPTQMVSHNWIPSLLRNFAAKKLMQSNWFARQVLLDRWFLHKREKPLVI
jgi:flavin-dependent dehydrogenase